MILGIDPGQQGALVWLGGDLGPRWERMPATPRVGVDLAAVRDLLEADRPDHAVVERAQAMPGQGLASTASYLRDYGGLLGLLCALRIPHETVHPSTWHRALCGPRTPGETRVAAKARAARVVAQRVPGLVLPPSKAVRAGVVDAACLAVWGGSGGRPPGPAP